MENSGESGDDGGPLGASSFLGAGGVSTSYIGVQSDDMEGTEFCLGPRRVRIFSVKPFLYLECDTPSMCSCTFWFNAHAFAYAHPILTLICSVSPLNLA